MNEHLSKRDLDLILEVNKKAVEIQMSVANQQEEIIESLNEINQNQKYIAEANKEQQKNIAETNKELNINLSQQDKEIYKLQILYLMGFLTLVGQIIQIFFKK